jgi:hypothetical protein
VKGVVEEAKTDNASRASRRFFTGVFPFEAVRPRRRIAGRYISRLTVGGRAERKYARRMVKSTSTLRQEPHIMAADLHVPDTHAAHSLSSSIFCGTASAGAPFKPLAGQVVCPIISEATAMLYTSSDVFPNQSIISSRRLSNEILRL